ncbi:MULTISPECIES: lipopolysaccharide assembly protein LapB [unclassified Agarivorans]|uniref:lipopolysaccharide assembly protein LapB n=1 Tax=unclassified Agarivorans TaxID=2636026 RepID=UPI003D7D52D5
MLGLLFLLLPVAAAYGWYMGQRSVRQNQQQQANHVSKQYVEGLNLLLANQSDKAVDLFIDLLQVDAETIDTHLALGNLFRQRGEVDRAIRIHQNLIAREGIDIEQRNLALQQLAKDYLAAGLFDRAEALLLELQDEPDYRQLALKQLLNIYQQTREWQQAIDIAKKLSPKDLSDVAQQIAHFYCEQAQEYETAGKTSKSLALLKKALSSDKNCVRASLHLAQIQASQGDYKTALKYLNQIPEQDIDFAPDALAIYKRCSEQLAKPEYYREFLEYSLAIKGSASVVVELSALYQEMNGAEQAQDFLVDELKRHPTMKGFHHLMGLHLDSAEEGQAKQSLQVLRSLVTQQLKIKPHYQCRRCGFSSHSIYWHCPSCKSWGTVKPIVGLDGE